MQRSYGVAKINILGPFILKGPIPSIFFGSLNIINQKPMIPRTHFHCITTWVARYSG